MQGYDKLIQSTELTFEGIIRACEEPCPAGLFVDLAMRTVDLELLREDPVMGMTAGGIMVRTGLYLCEQRDPLAYRHFLIAVSHQVMLECARIDWGDPRGKAWLASLEGIEEMPFWEFAAQLLDNGVAKQPLSLAWGLVRDGLIFCDQLGQEYYRHLLAGTDNFICIEQPRVKSWPRRALPP